MAILIEISVECDHCGDEVERWRQETTELTIRDVLREMMDEALACGYVRPGGQVLCIDCDDGAT